MAMQIDGQDQAPQERRTLDDLQQTFNNFAQQARLITDTIAEALRKHQAAGFGAAIGAAQGEAYMTDSTTSRTVEDYRVMLKALISYAVTVGDMEQAEADAMLQEAYGNTTETTVPPDQIRSLTNQWV